MKKLLPIILLTFVLSACVPGSNYNTSSSSIRNPMEDPQVRVLFRQGNEATVSTFGGGGCKAPGFNKAFSAAKQIKQISLRYISVMGQFGRYSDVEIMMAKDGLASSAASEILLLREIAKRAEQLGCRSIERKAYNEIMASPIFGTRFGVAYQQDMMIAQSKIQQLGRK